MKLSLFDPFRELEDMSTRLNQIFGRFPVRAEWREPGLMTAWNPAVDISETDNAFLIKCELPEMKKDDIKVAFEDNVLTISGERKQEKEEKGKKYHRIERSYGAFLRSFTLPTDVESSHAEASYKDGVLMLQVPKAKGAKSHAVDVKVS